jgi:NTP pyrophosphatase (non-canonical NTP hydrolase)
VTAAEASQEAQELLIAYIRSNYAPNAPTRRLLAAYEAQQAENARMRALLEEFAAAAMIRPEEPTDVTEVARLRAEVAALRQCLALANVEPTEAQIEGWRAAARGEALMNADEYQELANRTLIDRPPFELTAGEVLIAWNALGLAGEAGEVADLVKKGIFHQHGIDRDAIKKELGDVLWYVSALCTRLGFSLEEVMEANIEKLKARYPDGYSAQASKHRSVEP